MGKGLHDDVAHYPQASLWWRRDEGWMPESRTMLSRSGAASRAVVFIHGWGGSASSTWERFPQMVAEAESARQMDAFFLDYPSTTRQVAFCADRLGDFLTDLLSDPMDAIVNPSLPLAELQRPSQARYENILVVAHSMGAVVARRALLDMAGDGTGLDASDLESIRLLFFAPAHRGAHIAQLAGAGMGLDFLPGAKLVGECVKLFRPSLRDLDPASTLLKELLDDTKRAHDARAGKTEHLKATVLHADGDKVVEQSGFAGDKRTITVTGQNHRSICKPRPLNPHAVRAFYAWSQQSRANCESR